jgi:hypothetical protein
MKTQMLMPETQRSHSAAAPVWTLPRRQARRLAASTQTRWLRVLEGELWLTPTSGDSLPPSEDLWLRAGERLVLPPGAEFVAEGWRDSRFELLLAPAAAPRGAAAWTRALARRLRTLLRPQGRRLAAG